MLLEVPTQLEHIRQEMQMSDVESILDNSKRFKMFRNDLIRKIPRIPNDKVSLEALQSKNHTDLLIIYMCWRFRHVAVRPRKVTGLSVLEADCRAEALLPNIESFVKAVEAGTDLGPYLSKRAHSHGYAIKYDLMVTDSATREDRDLLLNVMGIHHFHLGLDMQANGFIERTNEVLLAHVTRDTFNVLGLFDHSVFEWTVDDNMTPERQRLWSIYDKYAESAQDAAVLIMGYGGQGISGAGTPVVITNIAIRQIKMIKNIEPKLNNPEEVKTLLGDHALSTRTQLVWHYQHLDFGLLDKKSRDFYRLMPGPT